MQYSSSRSICILFNDDVFGISARRWSSEIRSSSTLDWAKSCVLSACNKHHQSYQQISLKISGNASGLQWFSNNSHKDHSGLQPNFKLKKFKVVMGHINHHHFTENTAPIIVQTSCRGFLSTDLKFFSNFMAFSAPSCTADSTRMWCRSSSIRAISKVSASAGNNYTNDTHSQLYSSK